MCLPFEYGRFAVLDGRKDDHDEQQEFDDMPQYNGSTFAPRTPTPIRSFCKPLSEIGGFFGARRCIPLEI